MNTPKRVHLLLCWQLLLAQMCMAQSTGFVSLEGRQFMLDGQEFYPIAMNYSVLLARDSGITNPLPQDIYFAPDASFGPSPDFDCAGNCPQRLRTDFEKIRDMGFNTVRVVGGFCGAYRDTPEHGQDERRFSINLHSNPLPASNNHDTARTWVDLEEDLTGPYAVQFFNLINEMLDVADSADLKVILLAGGSSNRDSTQNRRHMYPTFDTIAVHDYAEYLGEMAEAVQDHPALLAYDLFNEPQFNTLEYEELGNPSINQSAKWHKQDICEFTTAWYDTINAHDPNHLVTLGGLGDYELEVWDPAVVHVDFYSLHIYPWKDYLGQWDPGQSMEYFQAKLHWFGQTCPMPWIIGETGWSANDDNNPPHTGPYPTYHEWPFTQGLETDQATFTAWCMDLTRQCGGSGWSWWYFQDFRWWDFYYDNSNPQGPAYQQINPQNGESLMLGIYYAMLRPGDGNADYYEKPAVDSVRNFILDPMPDPPGAEPANYDNWDNLPGAVSFSGTIQDLNTTQPIVNAQAWMRFAHVDSLSWIPNGMGDLETFHTAVTNTSGLFHYYSVPLLTGYKRGKPQNLITVGVGSEPRTTGSWTNTTIYNNAVYSLEQHPFQLDGFISGLNLTSQTNDPLWRFEGWTELRLQDVQVQGTPDPGATLVEFVAQDIVRVKTEFHAEVGSEVHLYNEDVFPACDDPSYRSMAAPLTIESATAAPSEKEQLRQIHLQFGVKAAFSSAVYPNPWSTHLKGTWVGEPVVELALLDVFGKQLGLWVASGGVFDLDLTSIAAGPYLLRIQQGSTMDTHTVIKQHQP